eukprot:scaffold110114_cov31-Prasinocladus_malaysianus.AAC.1
MARWRPGGGSGRLSGGISWSSRELGDPCEPDPDPSTGASSSPELVMGPELIKPALADLRAVSAEPAVLCWLGSDCARKPPWTCWPPPSPPTSSSPL